MSFDHRRALFQGATITQMCREFSVTPRALRYYEEQGLLAPARRQQMRVYSQRDRTRLRLILHGRRAGFTLRELRELLDVYDREGVDAQRVQALPKMKARLAALEERRRDLDLAIETLTHAAERLAESLGPTAESAA